MQKSTIILFSILLSKIVFAADLTPNQIADDIIKNDCFEQVYAEYLDYYPMMYKTGQIKEERQINFLTEDPMAPAEFYDNFNVFGFERLLGPTYKDETLRVLFGSSFEKGGELRHEGIIYSTESCMIVDVEVQN